MPKKDPTRWQEVLIRSPFATLTKEEVHDYYRTPEIQQALLDAVGKREAVLRQNFTPHEVVLRRKDEKGRFIHLTEKRLRDWNEKRLSEVHPTFGKKVDTLLVDIDPKEGVPWEKTKQIAETAAKTFRSHPDVQDVSVQFSGNRGFYVRGQLNNSIGVDRARNLTKRLLGNLAQRPDVSLGTKGRIRLDTTPLKVRGSVRAPYSLDGRTGLVAAPVKLEDLGKAKKKDFSIDKVLRKLRKKQAAVTVRTELLPHQQRVLDRIATQPGLVVAHGTGSGKTLSSLAALAQEGKPGLVLVPAALKSNYEKELKKHIRGSLPLELESQQRAVRQGTLPDSAMLVVDEAHRARNLTSSLQSLLRNANAEKRLLLTASPVYNRPADIAPLVNIAAGERVLPTGAEFNKRYIQRPSNSLISALFGSGPQKTTLKNQQELGNVLRKWVDYHKTTGGDFPTSSEQRLQVEMTPRQTQLHAAAWNKLPLAARLRLKAGLPPDKKNLAALNAFQSQARQVSGSERRFVAGALGAEVSPKIRAAAEQIRNKVQQDKDYKALVYSNYLDTLGDYAGELERAKVPYGVFSGEQSKKERDELVRQYNQGDLKALLVSSAGGEGLDLKGTRTVQVLEPHWNEEKLQQVIGRAIRHKSHAGLPKEKQNVLIQRFESHPKPGWLDRLLGRKPTGVEQVLAQMSEDKRTLNDALLGLLKQSEATVGGEVRDDTSASRVNWDDPLMEDSKGSNTLPTGLRYVGPTQWNGLESIQSGINRQPPMSQEDPMVMVGLQGLPKGDVPREFDPKKVAAAEFAPGIPKARKIDKLPTVKKTEPEWMMAIQEHKARKAGKHFDLRLVQPLTDKAHSWAIPKAKLPTKKDKMLLAIQQPTHKRDYALHFTGTLPTGYGAGTVTMPIKEKVKMLRMSPDRVKFERPGGEVFNMFRTKDNKWGIKRAQDLTPPSRIELGVPKENGETPWFLDPNLLKLLTVKGATEFLQKKLLDSNGNLD